MVIISFHDFVAYPPSEKSKTYLPSSRVIFTAQSLRLFRPPNHIKGFIYFAKIVFFGNIKVFSWHFKKYENTTEKYKNNRFFTFLGGVNETGKALFVTFERTEIVFSNCVAHHNLLIYC